MSAIRPRPKPKRKKISFNIRNEEELSKALTTISTRLDRLVDNKCSLLVKGIYDEFSRNYKLYQGIDKIKEDVEMTVEEKMAVATKLIKDLLTVIVKKKDTLRKKRKILDEIREKNGEILENMKNMLKCDNLDEDYKKVINDMNTSLLEKMEKEEAEYEDLNADFKKYAEFESLITSVPPCKICFDRNVNVALDCGHTFCKICVDEFKNKNDREEEYSDEEDADEDEADNGICPICRKHFYSVTNIFFN